MYFLKQLEHSVTLPPEYLGPHLDQLVRHALYQQVEGTCSGAHGYIVAVLSIDSVERGRVQEGTGSVVFPMRFTAVLLKVFKNEVVDAVVANVNKMGFFAQVGPLQVFISSHLVPSEYKFDAAGVPPCYASDTARIGPGDLVRLKIVGVRVDTSEIVAIGSIKEDYLGVL